MVSIAKIKKLLFIDDTHVKFKGGVAEMSLQDYMRHDRVKRDLSALKGFTVDWGLGKGKK